MSGLLATSQSLRSSVRGWNRGFRSWRWPKTPREVDGRHGGHSSHRRSWKTFGVVEYGGIDQANLLELTFVSFFVVLCYFSILLFFEVRLTWYAIVNYNFTFLVAVAAFLQSCQKRRQRRPSWASVSESCWTLVCICLVLHQRQPGWEISPRNHFHLVISGVWGTILENYNHLTVTSL